MRPIPTAATVITTGATDSSAQVATATTEPTIEAADSTLPVATAARETTEATSIFGISKIISIKIKELRTNCDGIPNNISCNELPNYSTPKSNRFAVESNSLNCNHKNAYVTVSDCLNTKIIVPDVQDVPKQKVLNNMLTNCSMLNTDLPRGKETENSNHEAMNKPVKGVQMYILKQL